jgi:hypothetical protein
MCELMESTNEMCSHPVLFAHNGDVRRPPHARDFHFKGTAVYIKGILLSLRVSDAAYVEITSVSMSCFWAQNARKLTRLLPNQLLTCPLALYPLASCPT